MFFNRYFIENMIRGLDSEECEFLSSFENMKEKEDKKKKQVCCFKRFFRSFSISFIL